MMIFLNYVVQEMKLQTHSVFQAGTAVWYFFFSFHCLCLLEAVLCIVVLPLEPRVLSC